MARDSSPPEAARATGFGGSPVRAWPPLPVGGERPLPTVVEFVGYGGGLDRKELLLRLEGAIL